MDVIKVAQKIQNCIERLEGAEDVLRDAVAARAVAIAEYDRDLGLCIARFKLGESVILDGKSISNPPATTTKELAKSVVWESKLTLEKAEGHYKVVISKIDGIKSQLVGWQSIYKRMDNV